MRNVRVGQFGTAGAGNDYILHPFQSVPDQLVDEVGVRTGAWCFHGTEKEERETSRRKVWLGRPIAWLAFPRLSCPASCLEPSSAGSVCEEHLYRHQTRRSHSNIILRRRDAALHGKTSSTAT